jgi:glutaconate CoA-transferase, subunit A
VENKIKKLSEVMELVEDGNSVAIGGVLNNRLPVALVHELIRRKRKNLDIISLEAPYAFDVLIGAGCVRSLDTAFNGFVSPGIGFAHMPNFRRAVEGGEMEMRENIGDCLILGFEIGRLGVPFLALRSIFGSDILKARPDYFKPIRSPFTQEDMIAIPAYNPDVALIHAHRADSLGNVQLDEAGFGLDEKIAFATKKVIVSVEEIVPHEEIRGRVNIPHFVVSAVVKAPWGAYPTSCYPFYDVDYQHLETYLKMAKERSTSEEYLQKYIFGCPDHEAFLDRAQVVRKTKKGGK